MINLLLMTCPYCGKCIEVVDNTPTNEMDMIIAAILCGVSIIAISVICFTIYKLVKLGQENKKETITSVVKDVLEDDEVVKLLKDKIEAIKNKPQETEIK